MKKMKNIYLVLVAMTSLSLGMSSCSQDEITSDSTNISKQTITFVSGEEETTTRTSMGGKYTDALFPFYWEGGDNIYVSAVQANGTVSGVSSAISGKVNGSATFTKQGHAIFTGTVPTLPSGGSYKIRYTGTGSYNTSANCGTAVITTINTSSDASTLVIPPLQNFTESELGSTTRFGAAGDCGTATATANSDGSYNFKLDHKDAYLILMPHWGNDETTNTTYKLKKVYISTQGGGEKICGRFSFNDNGVGSPISHTENGSTVYTNGSATLEISMDTYLPTSITQEKSINVPILPTGENTVLYCTYEVYNTLNSDTYYFSKVMPTVNYTANNIYTITADLKKSYENASSNGYLDLITNNPSKAYNYPNIYCNYVQWDCPTLGENYFISHEKGDNYNAITTPTNLVTDLVNVAGASCKNCPSYNEGSWYLKAGAYIDKNKKWGEGTNQIGGIWLKKKAAIVKSGLVSDENFGKTYSGTNSIKSVPSLPNGFDTTDWFFLPAAGYVNNHTTYNVGEYALYFLKTASTDGKFYTTGFQFLLDNASIDMENALRSWGAGLWDVQ